MKLSFPVIVVIAVVVLMQAIKDAPAQTTSSAVLTSVTLSYRNPTAQRVEVAGSFNRWIHEGQTLIKNGDVFTTSLMVPVGTHQYKFVVNGQQWIEDPTNPNRVSDTFGGSNSVLKAVAQPVVVSKPKATPTRTVSAVSVRVDPRNPFPSVTVEPLPKRRNRVTFTYESTTATVARVIGSFNGWSVEAEPMVKTGTTFRKTLELLDGQYSYKFFVDRNYLSDPKNPSSESDGYGGRNSVLRLGKGANVESSAARRGDGQISDYAFIHDPDARSFWNALESNRAVVKVKTLARDVEGVDLVVSGRAAPLPMTSEFEDERFEFWRATVTIGKTSEPIRYRFIARDGNTTAALVSEESNRREAWFEQSPTPDAIFRTPKWARDVVWYDLFPERFRNGSKDNDTTEGVRAWTSDWFVLEPRDKGAMFPSVFFRRYGGDLQGAKEKLPYLKSLGVGAIWLNPIFQSVSLHKYDATDYRHVDDEFGVAGSYEKTVREEDLLDEKTWKWSASDRVFLDFLKEAKRQGIRIVLDGVFNHTGTRHPAFQDVLRNGQNSKFGNWYNITKWEPLEWEGWAGGRDLPVFKENDSGFADPQVKEHIFAVTRRWMDPNGDGDPSDGIDGWRLDVANEVGNPFWREWRTLVKSINPDAIIISEIWDPADQWLQGDMFDCTMNYQFSKAMHAHFVNGDPPSVLMRELQRIVHRYPDQANAVMMNLMNSHDTDRLVSKLANPGRVYDQGNRQQDLKPGDKPYSSAKPSPKVYQRMLMLVYVQMGFVGSPLFYYGDEAGMWGADDPENRKPMIWKDLEPYAKPDENRFMPEIFAGYQRAAAIRNTFPALAEGEFQPVLSDDATMTGGFRRTLAGKSVVFLWNNSETTQTMNIAADWAANNSEWVDVTQDCCARVVPAGKAKASRTRIELLPKAKRLKVAHQRLTVTLVPNTSAVLVQP